MSLPGEEPAWRRAQASLDRLAAPLAATLALSRMNRTAESRAKWLEPRPDYQDLDHDLAELRRINREGALAAVMQIAAIMRRSEVVSDGVRVCALAGLGLFAPWAIGSAFGPALARSLTRRASVRRRRRWSYTRATQEVK